MAKILLVEDNVLNRDMLSRRLQKRGHEVLFAADAEQALRLVEASRPEVVLMDVGLPGLDGWEATRRLKQNPATAMIPVIALTAHALVRDREKAREVGCDEYESKPVDLPALLKKIDALSDPRVKTKTKLDTLDPADA